MELVRIGHCALRVTDVEASKAFYCGLLGFRLMEEDPDHGGCFMALPGDAHTLDVFQADDAGTSGGVLGHIAFKVGSYVGLREAHERLVSAGVGARLVDHVSQRSIYFADPDGTPLEIYYEYPTAREIFLNGRADEDRGFELDEPLPPWAADGTAGLAPTRPPTGEGVGENVSRLDGAVEDATSEVAVAIRALAEGSAAPDSEALAGRLREVVAPLLEELRSAKL